ncbi:MAG TPA: hypothetical protein VMS18_20320 [Candidatus Binatia bacterium]|nr:hypothetical protein [Candidatus Binatia bacterium]
MDKSKEVDSDFQRDPKYPSVWRSKVRDTDMSKLVVGQDVFLRSGGYGDWGKVVEVTPTGVIVQSDPCYGDELIRFGKNGVACDSSDLDVDNYKNIVLFRYGKTGYLIPAPCDRDFDIDRCRNIVSQYDETKIIPRAGLHSGINNYEFRQRFWESFECLKKHSGYSKIPGTECGAWKLYLGHKEAGIVLKNGKFIPGEPGRS